MLDSLREAGADQQVGILADRIAAYAPMPSVGNLYGMLPWHLVNVLASLRRAGADRQATALVNRITANVPLHNAETVKNVLYCLREAGADQQVAVLLARGPAAHVTLDNPEARTRLLSYGRSAEKQASIQTTMLGPVDMGMLVLELRQLGAHQQAAVLADRLQRIGLFRVFLRVQDSADQFRYGREADGTSAKPWGWEDLDLRCVSQG